MSESKGVPSTKQEGDKPRGVKWVTVWEDRFEQDGPPDSKKWSFDTDGNEWRWGNNELQWYTSEKANCRVENGVLIIEARKEKYQGREYTSARLRTLGKGDWLYGRFHVRARLPKQVRGLWPAIWMLPSKSAYGQWPRSGELDICENVGFQPDVVHCTLHCEAFNHMNGNQISNTLKIKDVAQGFHIFTLEWTPGRLRWLVDDKEVLVYDRKSTFKHQEWPFDQEFHLLLNLAVGGNWGGQKGVADDFPQRMEVDWVRVEQSAVPSGASTESSGKPTKSSDEPVELREKPIESSDKPAKSDKPAESPEHPTESPSGKPNSTSEKPSSTPEQASAARSSSPDEWNI